MLTRAIFRALCALLVGFLLISNPTEMTVLLVQIIGGLFAFSGLLAFISYFTAKVRATGFRPVFPIVGIGSLAFGVFLLIWPAQFVSILMYVLGILLCIIGLGQIISLINNRRYAPLTWSLFVLPLLITALGLIVLIYPMETASLPFTILGAAYIIYGIGEFIFGIRFYRHRRRYEKAQEEEEAAREAEVIEILDDSTPTTPSTTDEPEIPIDITR